MEIDKRTVKTIHYLVTFCYFRFDAFFLVLTLLSFNSTSKDIGVYIRKINKKIEFNRKGNLIDRCD